MHVKTMSMIKTLGAIVFFFHIIHINSNMFVKLESTSLWSELMAINSDTFNSGFH